jgi:hypothetical protein
MEHPGKDVLITLHRTRNHIASVSALFRIISINFIQLFSLPAFNVVYHLKAKHKTAPFKSCPG